MTGIILAGGAGRRFGKNKAFLKWGKQTLLEYTLAKLQPFFQEIIISVRTLRQYQHLEGVHLVKDILPQPSSLVGLYSALQSANYPYAFVLACDMPWVSARFIRYLINNIKDYDVIVPKTSGGLEPLCAVYSRRCLKPIKTQLACHDFKVTNFLTQVKVRIIQLADLDWLRNPEREFININTPDDYKGQYIPGV